MATALRRCLALDSDGDDARRVQPAARRVVLTFFSRLPTQLPRSGIISLSL